MRRLIRDLILPPWLDPIAWGVFTAMILGLLGLNWLGQPSGSWPHMVSLCLLVLSIPIGIIVAGVAHRFAARRVLRQQRLRQMRAVREINERMNPLIPNITAEEMAAKVRAIIQDPLIEIEPINPDYGSWRLRVKKGNLDMEYFCSPLLALGGSDLARPVTPDDTPFDIVDEGFQSLDEALEYLRKLAHKYA